MDNTLRKINIDKTKFLGKIKEAKDTFTFKFEIPNNLSWSEGSHFHIAFMDFIKDSKPNKDLVRSFSIMSLKKENCIAFTTRIKKSCSAYKQRLNNLQIGDEMFIFKIGNNIEIKNGDKPIIFLSMGVGVATFRPIIKNYLESPTGDYNITHINIDSSKDFIFKKELQSSSEKKFSNIYVESRKQLYQEIDNCLKNRGSQYYIVGSDDFIKNLISYLIYNSVKKDNIFLDKKMDLKKTFL